MRCMKLKSLAGLPIIIAGMFCALPLAQAQTYYERLLDDQEARIQQHLRDFRLVRMLETFPERLNATDPIKVDTVPSGGIVALHDHQSGKALDACKTPCTLNLGRGRDYLFVAYKSGYATLPKIESAQGWSENYKGNHLMFTLGVNLRKHYKNAYKCWKEWDERLKQDRDVEVCSRIPAYMPYGAKVSGFCRVAYDISEEGRVINSRITECSDPIFEAESLQVLKHWFYYPKVERGSRVVRSGLKSKITFRLQDLDGTPISEP